MLLTERYYSINEILNCKNEMLSPEKVKELTDFISNYDLDDNASIKQYIDSLKKVSYYSSTSNEGYEYTLLEKYNNDQRLVNSIMDLFSSEDDEELLYKILDNGCYSLSELKASGNIYNDLCNEFTNEAKELAKLKPTNRRTGNFEVLFTFIIDGAKLTSGSSYEVGDVIVDDNRIEVKSNNSHPIGREDISSPVVIYSSLDEALGIRSQGKVDYPAGNNIEVLNGRLSKFLDNNGDISKVADAIVDGVIEQYRASGIDRRKLYNSASDFLSSKRYITKDDFISLIGYLQLCCYMLKRDMDLIIFNSSGKYLFIDRNTRLMNANEIINNIKFKELYTTSSAGYSVKMNLKD